MVSISRIFLRNLVFHTMTDVFKTSVKVGGGENPEVLAHVQLGDCFVFLCNL